MDHDRTKITELSQFYELLLFCKKIKLNALILQALGQNTSKNVYLV